MYILAEEDAEPRHAANADPFEELPTIEHAGLLEDLDVTPPSLVPGHVSKLFGRSSMSCSFCGVGDGGSARTRALNAW